MRAGPPAWLVVALALLWRVVRRLRINAESDTAARAARAEILR